jgi:hypothetical protein
MSEGGSRSSGVFSPALCGTLPHSDTAAIGGVKGRGVVALGIAQRLIHSDHVHELQFSEPLRGQLTRVERLMTLCRVHDFTWMTAQPARRVSCYL